MLLKEKSSLHKDNKLGSVTLEYPYLTEEGNTFTYSYKRDQADVNFDVRVSMKDYIGKSISKVRNLIVEDDFKERWMNCDLVIKGVNNDKEVTVAGYWNLQPDGSFIKGGGSVFATVRGKLTNFAVDPVMEDILASSLYYIALGYDPIHCPINKVVKKGKVKIHNDGVTPTASDRADMFYGADSKTTNLHKLVG